jgi:hypothetical protein
VIRSTKIALAGAFAAGAVVMVCAAMTTAPDPVDQPELIDAPISTPTPSATPTATPLPEPAPVNEDPWLIADDGTQHFEDGSWLEPDGTIGCTDGMPCSQLPPVPVNEPMTPNGGYFPTLTLRPCPVEDADNCYWDAARMGNGQGTSFITVDGVTYYPAGQ